MIPRNQVSWRWSLKTGLLDVIPRDQVSWMWSLEIRSLGCKPLEIGTLSERAGNQVSSVWPLEFRIRSVNVNVYCKYLAIKLIYLQDFKSLRKQHGLGDVRKVLIQKGADDGLGLSITVGVFVSQFGWSNILNREPEIFHDWYITKTHTSCSVTYFKKWEGKKLCEVRGL